jgi:hypothetical protein
MRRTSIATAAVAALILGGSTFALLGSGIALGTMIEVGTAPGDVIDYGPSTGASGTTGTTGTSGATATTGTTGATASTSPVPQCPGTPCLAVSQTTAFQVKVGSDRSISVIPRNGTIVAWTVTLSSPTTTAPAGDTSQTTYFDDHEGGAAAAGIAVLKPGKKLNYTLVAQSPTIPLLPYFGETVQFPLATTIPVTKGEILALTVPTWAPVLALSDAAGTDYGKFTSWRSSRQKGGCVTTSQTAQQSLRSTVQYYCLYQSVRLAYSALEVSTP